MDAVVGRITDRAPAAQHGTEVAAVGLTPWEVAARRFESRPEVSIDLELWNMIRAAKGQPEQTMAEAEAEMQRWIDSGEYLTTLGRTRT